jgi:hypothetical protein
MGKPARMTSPANQGKQEMRNVSVFLPLIIVIFEVKVKIIRKPR